MRLPEGLSVDMCINNRTGELFYHVTATKEYIESVAINILDQRIERAKLAIRCGKHTKRIAHTRKLLNALEDCREHFDLPTRLEGSD